MNVFFALFLCEALIFMARLALSDGTYAILPLMKRWILILSMCTAVLGAPLSDALAISATPKPAAMPGQGLEISPPVLELSADPGQTVTATIRVRNVSSGILIASGKSDDFGASGEDGKPKLLLNEQGATRFSLKYWVGTVPNLTLAPQELKTATVNISVPKNAEPGGHFGVIRFTATPPDLQGTGVSLSASVGTLVLLRVSGAVTDKLSVASFTATQDGKTNSFFEHGPLSFTLRLQNDGSVHEKPTGTITIKSMFGSKVATVLVNQLGGNVLPASVRRFDQSMANKQLFGRYTATFAGSYLDDNHKLVSSVSFWIIPWKLILLIIVGLATLVWLIKIAIRRYNSFIIAQARRR
jgi:hypothetical protein